MRRGKRRPVASRRDILDAARAIGVRDGWEAVTIRAVANRLGYSSPLLYEHFRDKEHLLTEIATDALLQVHAHLAAGLPKASRSAAIVVMERYWGFMIENTQLYRLMNGMGGPLVNHEEIQRSAEPLCLFIACVVRPLAGKDTSEADAVLLAEELWALLHGMAALYLDRLVPFDMKRVVGAGLRLIAGAPKS
jgi:AcrR family transcriptional regulator